MPIEDSIKPLEVKHKRAKQILGVEDSAYWQLVRDGWIKTVGSGKNSRAVYASVEAYHRQRLAAAGTRTASGIAAWNKAHRAAKKTNKEIVAAA